MRTRTSIVAALLLLGACMAARTLADDPPATGTVVGKVVDASGNPAADAIVTLGQSGQKMRQALDTATDREGKFKLENVPEGDYNLNVRSKDIKLKATRSLSVTAGHTTDIGTLKLKGK